MANNRLLLECTVCGDVVGLARLSAGEDEWSPARETTEAVAVWLSMHGDHDGTLHVRLQGENDERLDLVLPARP